MRVFARCAATFVLVFASAAAAAAAFTWLNGRQRGLCRRLQNAVSYRMPRALFLCTHNRLRSPTAEQVFASWPGIETDSARLGADADIALSPEQLAWAEIVFVMEKKHKARLSSKFGRYLNGKRVICLDIPDDYAFMQPELIRLLEAKAGRFLKRI